MALTRLNIGLSEEAMLKLKLLQKSFSTNPEKKVNADTTIEMLIMMQKVDG